MLSLSARARSAVRPALLVLVLVGLAVGSYAGRRGLIGSWFSDGGEGPAPRLTQPEDESPGVQPVPRVRVVLIDGLGLGPSRGLPQLNRACARGLDVVVDNGFPTVSLPVQHVLWTGRTQVQSGVMYRIPGLTEPPHDALPGLVPGSAAVAESHAGIVHSFGFADARPPIDHVFDELGSAWRTDLFASMAVEAVVGPSALAFVHVLRVDEAGHAYGAASLAYAEAAAWSDDLLDRLIAAEPDPAHTRWFVLSDHGHLPGGGHGGAESTIRRVRACIFGGPPLAIRSAGRSLHLVDLHRAIAESVGIAPTPESRGRPLDFALAHPDPDATLPSSATLLELAVACGLMLVGLVVTGRSAAGRFAALPWWLGVAYAGQVLVFGVPTLSNPVIYPPLGRDMLVAALPGLVVLGFSGAFTARALGIVRAAITGLAVPLAAGLAALTLCGGTAVLFGATDRSPLVPWWTAHASWLLSACLAGSATLAVVLLVAGRRRAG